METKNNQRHYLKQDVIIRAAGENDEKQIIEGYGSVFEHRSKILYDWWDGWFYEVIERGAFDDVLKAENLNVVATVNHIRDKMLGRTKSGTLRLEVDEKGLKYSIDVPDTTLGRDTLEQIKRGDFFESSFVFTVDDSNIRWDETEDGIPVRYIEKVKGLYDVAIVTDGAYSNTEVAARAYQQYQDQKKEREVSNLEHFKRKLKLRQLKNK